MALIARTTEKDIDYKKRFSRQESDVFCNIATAISHATVTTAHDLNAKAIDTVPKQGQLFWLISKYRPTCPLISCTPSERI